MNSAFDNHWAVSVWIYSYQSPIVHEFAKVNTLMGCVRHGVTGEEVMSKADFAAWWDEVCELRDSGVACGSRQGK